MCFKTASPSDRNERKEDSCCAQNGKESIYNENNELKAVHALPLLPVAVYGTLQFSLAFPEMLWSKASLYYIPAWWHYDKTNTFFDNTAWTWGTDYAIGAFMAIWAWKCITCKGSLLNNDLRHVSALLLALYCISVLSGGWAHQHCKTLNCLNSFYFRLLWFVCVGTVAMAGGVIGAIGSKLGKSFDACDVKTHFRVPILPDHFWIGWSILLTAVCALGGMSFKRPACDIFIAGTTQFVPTAYSIITVFSRKWNIPKDDSNRCHNQNHFNGKTHATTTKTLQKYITDNVSLSHRLLYYISLLLNAPLLPSYPLLLHQKLPLGLINTILHANLLIAWSLQFYTVWGFALVFANAQENSKQKKHLQ